MIGRRRELGPAVPPARARHLWRAGIGAVVMAFLMVGLLMIDEEVPVAPAADATQVPAVAPNEPAKPNVDSGAIPVAAESAPADASAGAGSAPPAELAPADASAAGADNLQASTVEPPVEPVAECAPAPVAARAPLPPPGAGFMIQLGVFGDPSNADSLRDELGGQGYPAHVQSRVVLGPYASRNAAQAAHDKLRRDRRIDGMIIPPRKP